jgi:hypothetical protein
MNIFEITNLKEEVSKKDIERIKSALAVYSKEKNKSSGQSDKPVQAIGKVSSARAAGDAGSVRPGEETNALDAMAADKAKYPTSVTNRKSSSNTTTKKIPGGTQTTTTSSASGTIKGLSMIDARKTPEWQKIYAATRGSNKTMKVKRADMKYRQGIINGEITPPGNVSMSGKQGSDVYKGVKDEFDKMDREEAEKRNSEFKWGPNTKTYMNKGNVDADF